MTETFLAHGAFEGLLFAVDILVVPEVILPTEGFTADVAREGSLVRVSSLVDQQVVALGEFSAAVK